MCLGTVAIANPLLGGLVAHGAEVELTEAVCGLSIVQVLQLAFEGRSGHDRSGGSHAAAAFVCVLLGQLVELGRD